MRSIVTQLRRGLHALAAFTLLAATVGALLIHPAPVAAYGNTYPWSDATELDAANYDWGYSTCPSSAPGCKATGMTWTAPNGTVYGEADARLFYFRNCTSYASWIASSLLSINTSGWGNAKDWHTAATNAGYSVSSTPRVGDIADWGTSAGSYGHVAYVYAVGTDGKASIAEYNWGVRGGFNDTRKVGTAGTTGAPDWYIHLGTPTDPTPPPAPPADTDADGVPDTSDVAPLTPGPVANRGIPDHSAKVTGDFNGDGKTDIAAFYDYGNSTTGFWVWYGNGNGTFTAPTSPAWSSGTGNWAWANTKSITGDFNGDGKTDVGVFYNYGNSTSALFVFTSTGSGFNGPVTWWNSGNGNWVWENTKAVTGDFNGDGKTDVGVFYAYAISTTAFFVFSSTGTGFSTPSSVWNSGNGNWVWGGTKPVTGDFNADGKIDVGAFYNYGNSTTTLWTWTGNGNGTIGGPVMVWNSGSGNWDWNNTDQLVGDFNGDGKTDVAALYNYGASTTGIWWFLSTGTGFSGPASVWNSGSGNWEWNNDKSLTGDFNGDGKTDIGSFYNYGASTTGFWVFTATGTGFSTPTSVWSSGYGNWDWARTLSA